MNQPQTSDPLALTIVDWWKTFETSHSRKLVRPIGFMAPSGCNSKGYLVLALERGVDGLTALGIFQALSQLMSSLRPEVRSTGQFLNSNGQPMTIAHIAARAHLPVEQLKKAITILSDQDIGWLAYSHPTQNQRETETTPASHRSPTDLPPSSQLPPDSISRGSSNSIEEGEGETYAREKRSAPPPSILDHLRIIFPDAPSSLTSDEQAELLSQDHPFHEWSPADWAALSAWRSCPDRIRGRTLWPRCRAETILHAAELTEKLRFWWRSRGKFWEASKKPRRAETSRETANLPTPSQLHQLANS